MDFRTLVSAYGARVITYSLIAFGIVSLLTGWGERFDHATLALRVVLLSSIVTYDYLASRRLYRWFKARRAASSAFENYPSSETVERVSYPKMPPLLTALVTGSGDNPFPKIHADWLHAYSYSWAESDMRDAVNLLNDPTLTRLHRKRLAKRAVKELSQPHTIPIGREAISDLADAVFQTTQADPEAFTIEFRGQAARLRFQSALAVV